MSKQHTQIQFLAFGFRDILEEDEQIKQIFRKNFSSYFSRILFHVILWGGFVYCVWFLFNEDAWWAELLILLYGFYKIFFHFLKWYLNCILMTDKAIIFLDWKSFFHKKSTRMDYWGFDEIEVERAGMEAFVRNYGTLIFVKAGGGKLKEFKNISKPKKVAKIIESYREHQIDSKNFTEESALKDLLSKMVKTHVKTNGQIEKKPLIVKKESPFKKEKNEATFEIEKEMDDDGGFEIDLEERN